MSKRGIEEVEEGEEENESLLRAQIERLKAELSKLASLNEGLEEKVRRLEAANKSDLKTFREANAECRAVIEQLSDKLNDPISLVIKAGEICRDEMEKLRQAHNTNDAEKSLRQNSSNLLIVSEYTHEKFMIEIKSKAPFNYRFIDSLYDTNCGVVDEEIKQNTLHHMASMLAWPLSYFIKEFSWEYSTGLQHRVRSLTRSTTVQDIMGFTYPGACSSEAVKRRYALCVDQIKNAGYDIFGQSTLIMIYDNISGLNGGRKATYKRRHSFGGKEDEHRSAVTVATAMAAMHIFEVDGDVVLQKFAKYGPRADKLLDGSEPTNMHELLREPIYCDQHSEVAHEVAEMQGYLKDRLEETNARRAHDTTSGGGEEDDDERDADGRNPDLKYCNWCEAAWPMNKKKCDVCTRTMTSESVYKKTRLASQRAVSSTYFAARHSAATARKRLTDTSSSGSSGGSSGSSSSRGEGVDLILVSIDPHAKTASELKKVDDEDSSEDGFFKYEVLLPMMENPSGKDAIERVLTQ